MFASDVLGIEPETAHDWFNICLFRDTKVFLDPYLISTVKHPDFEKAGDRLTSFFDRAYHLGAHSRGELVTPAGEKLKHMLLFPEPEELCLGYAKEGNHGSGTGAKHGTVMINAILEAISRGITDLKSFDEIGLIHEGVGRDRISDIAGRILLPQLARYTQKVAGQNSKALVDVKIPRSEFNFETLKWETLSTRLPLNPFKKKPFIIVPKCFLRRSPTLDPEDFQKFLLEEFDWQSDEETRTDLNWNLISTLDVHALIKLAREKRFLVRSYLEKRRNRPVFEPYNFAVDPDGVNNSRAAQRFALSHPQLINAVDAPSFVQAVRSIINAFKLFVEDNAGYKLLWNDQLIRPKREEAAQLLFVGITKAYCIANNVDLSREVNLGCGPVDFKFSAGYKSRALVEVKRANNGKFLNGLRKQLVKLSASKL